MHPLRYKKAASLLSYFDNQTITLYFPDGQEFALQLVLLEGFDSTQCMKV